MPCTDYKATTIHAISGEPYTRPAISFVLRGVTTYNRPMISEYCESNLTPITCMQSPISSNGSTYVWQHSLRAVHRTLQANIENTLKGCQVTGGNSRRHGLFESGRFLTPKNKELSRRIISQNSPLKMGFHSIHIISNDETRKKAGRTELIGPTLGEKNPSSQAKPLVCHLMTPSHLGYGDQQCPSSQGRCLIVMCKLPKT